MALPTPHKYMLLGKEAAPAGWNQVAHLVRAGPLCHVLGDPLNPPTTLQLPVRGIGENCPTLRCPSRPTLGTELQPGHEPRRRGIELGPPSPWGDAPSSEPHGLG